MVRRGWLLLAIGALLLAPGGRAQAADYLPGEVVVQLRPGVDINLLCNLFGLRILARSPYVPAFRLGVGLTRDIDALVAALRLYPGVTAADPNLISSAQQASGSGGPGSGPNPDPGPGYQWTSTFDGGDGPKAYVGQTGVGQVDFCSAAQVSSGAGVQVAILDTGISARHPFIAARLLPGRSYVDNVPGTDDAPTGTDSGRNGLVDEAAGHGTMIAGIVLRFAPSVALLPVKVLDSDGNGTLWGACEGVRYAAANGAAVLNLSFGFARNSGALTQAINDVYTSGAVVVTSAGNGNQAAPQFPGGNPNAITIAALNPDNTKASFSNYGAAIDVDAPGVEIYSAFWDGRFAAWSGTSFAAPFIAAEAALIRSRAPAASPDQVKQRILATSHSVNAWNPLYVNQLGKGSYGLVDFDAALYGL
jgi:hypothetical protein